MTHTLNDVINSCQQTINLLYSVASQIPNPVVQNKLSESAHHLRHCVEDCRFAAQKQTHQNFSLQGQWGLGQQLWGLQPYQVQQQVPFTTPYTQTQVKTPLFV